MAWLHRIKALMGSLMFIVVTACILGMNRFQHRTNVHFTGKTNGDRNDDRTGSRSHDVVEQRSSDAASSCELHAHGNVPQERVVICMVAHGWKAAGYEDESTIKGSRRSMDLALRGILRHASQRCRLHFHFITGVDDRSRIRELLSPNISIAQSLRMPTPVTYDFIDLNESQLDVWMDAVGHRATHRTGSAGNIKFFYPLVFPHEERVLMLDSDVLVARDICDLWSHFHRFSATQLFSFAPQMVPFSLVKDNQFNAGVALLHLRRMREAGWLKLAKDSIDNWHEKGMKPRCCAHGDQSVFHMIRFFQPSVLSHYLPRWWNINKCHKFQNFETHYKQWLSKQRQPKRHVTGGCTAEHGTGEDDAVFVGLVHLGCCKMCRREQLHGRWRRLLDDILQFPLQSIQGPFGSQEVLCLNSSGSCAQP